MRRNFWKLPLAATAATALTVSLAACSSDSTSATTASTSSSSSAASTGQFPVTVATQFGDVKVASAKRVVALGWADAETAYALGVQPVGISDWLAFGGDGVGSWATSLVKDKAEQLGTTELDFEKIAALKPDLILDTRSDNSKDTYAKLSAIAPTVYGPTGVTSYGTPWDVQTETVAKALGLADKGTALVTDTKKKLADFAAAHPALAGKTFAVGALYGTNQWGAYVSGDLRVDFLTALGMTNKPAIESQKKDSFFVSVSAENLSLFDADLTLMFAIGDNDAALKSDAVLNNLASAKAGHLVYLDKDEANAYSDGSVLAIDYALTNVAPKIATAVAK